MGLKIFGVKLLGAINQSRVSVKSNNQSRVSVKN